MKENNDELRDKRIEFVKTIIKEQSSSIAVINYILDEIKGKNDKQK